MQGFIDLLKVLGQGIYVGVSAVWYALGVILTALGHFFVGVASLGAGIWAVALVVVGFIFFQEKENWPGVGCLAGALLLLHMGGWL